MENSWSYGSEMRLTEQFLGHGQVQVVLEAHKTTASLVGLNYQYHEVLQDAIQNFSLYQL